MENISASSSSSSASAGSRQFEWLQTTLSDLDKKMKAMMTLLKEDDKSTSYRALFQILQELYSSYCSLVEKYDRLRSPSLSANSSEVHTSIYKKRAAKASNDPLFEASGSQPESAVNDSDIEHYRRGFEYLNKLADDLILTEQCDIYFLSKPEKTNTKFSDDESVVSEINEYQGFEPKAAELQKGGSQGEHTWFQLKSQFTKLMEENLRQQAELLRRNDEKRETINELRIQLERLKSENRHLQKCLCCANTGLKGNRCQSSKSRRLLLGKFFQGGCS